MPNPPHMIRHELLALMAMKICSGLMAGLFLIGMQAQANPRSLTRSGVSEEITLNILKSKVPQGAEVTNTSCKEIQTAGFNYSYRCTITWEE